MAYKDTLKNSIPEAQRKSVPLQEFVDAVGELLDGYKNSINNLKHSNDAALVTESALAELAKGFDIDLLHSMALSRKRDFVGQAIMQYTHNGTEKALRRIFRLIGWDVLIETQWLVLPTFRAGEANEIFANLDPTNYLCVGEAKVYPDGYTYADLRNPPLDSPVTQVGIYGQDYGELSVDQAVSSVPYLKITVTGEDFKTLTAPYVVDNSGYSFTATEVQDILELIRLRLLDTTRPANVKITEISTPTHVSEDFMDMPDISDVSTSRIVLRNPTYDGTLIYEDTLSIEYYDPTILYSGATYNNDTPTYVTTAANLDTFTKTYAIGKTGEQTFIPTRVTEGGTDFTVDIDANAKVSVVATSAPRQTIGSTATWLHVATYDGANLGAGTYGASLGNGFTAVKLVIYNPSVSSDIDFNITYKV